MLQFERFLKDKKVPPNKPRHVIWFSVTLSFELMLLNTSCAVTRLQCVCIGDTAESEIKEPRKILN